MLQQQSNSGTLSSRNNLSAKPRCAKLSEWIVILMLCAITFTIESSLVEPHKQCIPGWTTADNDDDIYYVCGEQRDPRLQYPHVVGTVSTKNLMVVSLSVWALTILYSLVILFCYDRLFSIKSWLVQVEIMLRMLFCAGGTTQAVVSVMKFCIGCPRPNFYALMEEGYTKSARMSFPSAHSSLSVTVLFLFTLNLYAAMQHAQLRLYKYNKQELHASVNNAHAYFYVNIWWRLRYRHLLCVVLVLSPTFLAFYIACTRVTDYWHHSTDVAVGSLLGFAGAILAFETYKFELYGSTSHGHTQMLLGPHQVNVNEAKRTYESEVSMSNTSHKERGQGHTKHGKSSVA